MFVGLFFDATIANGIATEQRLVEQADRGVPFPFAKEAAFGKSIAAHSVAPIYRQHVFIPFSNSM